MLVLIDTDAFFFFRKLENKNRHKKENLYILVLDQYSFKCEKIIITREHGGKPSRQDFN